MRKFLISILLASAAASPALAARHNDDSDRQEAREERAQAREERQQAREQSREDGSKAVERQSFARPERAERAAPPQQQSFDRQSQFNADRDVRRDERAAIRDDRRGQRQQVVEQLRDNRELRQSTRIPHVMRTRVPVVSEVPRIGTQPPPPAEVRHTAAPQWSTNWRHDSHYDWYNHRRHHRSLFHLGFYFDPFGWGYNPYQIGWRLWPSYYSSNYWINDPWEYRLPYAPPGTRWVRYYDDAILVDMWSGEVVDVIYNFFW
jgi:Ni/Co efflux regulator RcnB